MMSSCEDLAVQNNELASSGSSGENSDSDDKVMAPGTDNKMENAKSNDVDENELEEIEITVENKTSGSGSDSNSSEDDCPKQENIINADQSLCKKEIEDLNSQLTSTKEIHEKLKSDYMKLRTAYMENQEKLSQQEARAKQAITNLQNDYNKAIKTLKDKCATAEKEKSNSVMNYARREKELLDCNRKIADLDKKYKTTFHEKDKLSVEVKNMAADISKLKTIIAKKEKNAKIMHSKIEEVKEDASSHNIKIKWAQNKLKTEVDAHNETKEKLAKALASIKQANEETEQIRKNCQEMIKTYQESEEIKSNSLESQLKESTESLNKQRECVQSLENKVCLLEKEIASQKQQLEQLQDEIMKSNTYKEELENMNESISKKCSKYEQKLNDQKRKISELNSKLEVLLELELELENSKAEIERLNKLTVQGDELVKQTNSEKDEWKLKEQELLDFTMKLTTKNAELSSSCENQTSKLNLLESEAEEKSSTIENLQAENLNLLSKIESLEDKMNNEADNVKHLIEERDKSVCNLTIKLEEKSDEIRSIKRKNTARIKDLTRQLQQFKKELKNGSDHSSLNGDHIENGLSSRTGSCGSLDIIEHHSNHQPSVDSTTSISSNNSNDHASVPDTMITTPPALNHGILVERIIRLQHVHARKNEKIDFLQDHVLRLTEQLQKQSRLIQHYMLREESGMLSQPIEHFEKSRGKITLEFSLEINQKMQTVLEDTILKNIALKESVDALGAEVAKLSKKVSS